MSPLWGRVAYRLCNAIGWSALSEENLFFFFFFTTFLAMVSDAQYLTRLCG